MRGKYIRQKSEDNLAMAESELDKHTTLITDLTRKVDELQVKADEAAKLKDQVDEWVHFQSASHLIQIISCTDIVMQQISCKRLKTSWTNTRRNSKKALSYAKKLK